MGTILGGFSRNMQDAIGTNIELINCIKIVLLDYFGTT